MHREAWYTRTTKRTAHLTLALALAAWPALRAEEPLRYRFEAGESFRYLVAQETRPAQGPAFARAELVYAFEVLEADAAGARLRATISGTGTRGPDEDSRHAAGLTGRRAGFSDIRVDFRLTDRGPSLGAAGETYRPIDEAARELTPEQEWEPGTGEWAMVLNCPQFFPYLAEEETLLAGAIHGPDLFRLFPEDRPELTGLLWQTERMAMKLLAPRSVRVGELELMRIDFLSGFRKRTTHRSVNFAGTYRVEGFALIDPARGRPVCYKIDEEKSQYQISVTGGSYVPRLVAARRLAAANDGRTSIGLEAVDPEYFEALREYAGLELLAGSGLTAALPAGEAVAEEAASAGGLFGSE